MASPSTTAAERDLEAGGGNHGNGRDADDRLIPADEEEETSPKQMQDKDDEEAEDRRSSLLLQEKQQRLEQLQQAGGAGAGAGEYEDGGAAVEGDDDGDEDPLVVATRDACLGVLRKVFCVIMPLSVVASVFACIYGWIFVNSPRYLADPDAWQRCIVYNVNQPGATPQNFAVSASAFGGVMFIFMGLGFKAGYLALHDIDLLPYSLSITCFTLLGQMVYRPVNPVVPAITELTPTLVSLTYFIKPSMYDKVPLLPGATESPCGHAYGVNAAFLAFQFIIFAANIINLFLQIYATIRLRGTPRRGGEPYVLIYHKPALVLAACAVACYVTTIAAKEDAALQTLFLLDRVGRGFLFPFVRPALDTIGLFMLLTVASILYGACKQEPESFKWAAFTAYVHVLLSYPIITSNFQAYHLYDFWTPSGCKKFLEQDNTHAGGGNRQLLFIFASINYPEAEEAFCRDTRVALIGQFLQFVVMHLAIAACLLVVIANWRIEPPAARLFGAGSSKASSLLFPNSAHTRPSAPTSPQAAAAASAPSTTAAVAAAEAPVRLSSSLQEPLLALGAGAAASSGSGGNAPAHQRRATGDGGSGALLLPTHHHRRRSSTASVRSVGSQRSRTSSAHTLNNHLLGPVLD